MAKNIACFCKKIIFLSYFKLSICLYKEYFSLPFAVFISIHRMNCYVICLLYFSCHFIREETYISNITSFPTISVFMFTNV